MEFTQGKWELTDLYPDKGSFQADLDLLKEKAKSFASCREELKPGLPPEEFYKILKEYESINDLAQRLGGYTGLQVSANTQDSGLLGQLVHTRSVVTEIANQIVFFELWFQELPDAEADKYIEGSPDFRYYLTSLRLSKPHILGEKEEQIINTKNMTGRKAMVNIYNAITNRYVFDMNIEGSTKHLTRGELMSYARSVRREERKAAYEELFRVYEKDSTVLGQIYQSIVRDWDQETLNFRHYDAAISARNLGNDIPDEVVSLLLSTCRKNKGIFTEFFKWKNEKLGLGEMHRYDLYAPIIEEKEKIGFDDAYRTVLSSYASFDPEFAEMAERVYKHRHIDSEVRHGKRSGAFCQTVSPKFTPWVLVNYQGKVDDISTLAHELGHAIHSMCAADKNSFQQHACLPLAETASTFGEMILSDYLEQRVTDKDVLINMLSKEMDDNYAVIQRQAYFALFEIKAHQMIAEGADANKLAAAYYENLSDQFAEAMTVDEQFKWEWIAIPHIFHTPFYVYAYSFGQLLVLALYNQYKTEGKSFIPRYKEMLHKGGSQRPGDLLMDAGFDFTKESFWQGGFDILKGKIDRLKALS